MDTESTQQPMIQEAESGIKRTSINLPEDLWDELKIVAIRRKLSATAAVEIALRYWLDSDAPVPTKAA